MVKLDDYGFKKEELMELSAGNWGKTGFPYTKNNRRLVIERLGLSLEEPYFWVINFLRDDFGFHEFEKICDVFTGSVFSGFGSQQATKTGVVQDRASNFLATAGKMSKEIFQILRELRIIDEKIGHYEKSWGMDEKTKKRDSTKKLEPSEIVLKGYWVDLVDGGSKSPTSVYGMSQQLGYGPLPDLFFKVHPETMDEVDKTVDKEAGQFNEAVRTVLKRKLQAYIKWKEETYKELETRKKFTVKYLNQHYQVIKMYLDWAKPYLKAANILKPRGKHLSNVDLVSSFDTTLLEIEYLAKGKKSGIYTPILLMHFFYSSQPQGKYNSQYNQTEIVHNGRLEITWRGYAWTDAEIWAYKKMREDEDNELIGDVIGSMNNAMDEYGDELRKYLKEIGQEFNETYEEKKEKLLCEQILNLSQNYKKDIEKIKSDSKKTDERIIALEKLYKDISKRKKGIGAPIKEISDGFKEIFGALIGKDFFKDEIDKGILITCKICKTQNANGTKKCSKCGNILEATEEEKDKEKANLKKAADGAGAAANVSYDKFKKAHRMITW